jgi:acyl transferase domain-containing protein/3-hydroxymyristoyl/3-hydroxydecanoyl-(acyl carrier protein) dehydratase
MNDPIAVVSFAGRFPGAGADLARFWANVAAARDCARDAPPGRWALPADRCTDPRVANPDTVYTARGYYLDPFEPDLDGLALDRALVAQLDPLFHLVLDVGNRAWRGARTEQVDRARVSVILGNICLPTDRANDLCREVQNGANKPSGTHPLNRYVAGLPAGLLARGLGFGGGSFTLDAACASSLYALKLACDELHAGRADAVLAGGCSRPDCQYTQMGFAQLRALAPSGRCAPFDARADGLVVGEGAGVFVLKRLRDALAHGDTIRGVIAGVGLSNDMHGNLLAPAKEGQLRAMRAAYARANWKPTDADLIECHATGTPVGDAIEFESLRELWGASGWRAGQCTLGSVKSTVGHLLTGAGAAALAKVLLALENEELPPQANFDRPAAGLNYEGGPFRVRSAPAKWERRGALVPRRAAVSGFGFGGVNAHLLIEEWVPTARKSAPPVPAPKPEPVAVVGVAAHVGPWADARALGERLLAGGGPAPEPKTNGWARASAPCPPGFLIDELAVPIDRFRIPPKELEEALPQQLLMLTVAAAALDDQTNGRSQPGEDYPFTGAFVGLGLDPNATNFHLRWSARAAGADPDAASPPLTANRTMGALGSIAASRIARTFHFGGPCHTVCSEEGSAARAVELAARALQTGELDRALAGGVDLAGDPRLVLPGAGRVPGEGAAALVLKRLRDAECDGDTVYAVIRGIGVASDADEALRRAGAEAGARDGARAFDATDDAGHTGAASAAVSLLKACFALRAGVLPGAPPQYWLHNRADGPRRATVTARGADGSHFAFVLEECPRAASGRAPAQPLGARSEAAFAVEGDSPADLVAGLQKVRALADARAGRHIEALARAWYRAAPPGNGRRAVGLAARSAGELREQIEFVAAALRANPDAPLPASAKPALRDRAFYAPEPLGPKGKVALVFPGSGNHFDGMGRDLAAHFPAVMRRQHAENARLRDQFAPQFFWCGRTAEAPPRDLLFGQVTVGALTSDVLLSLGVRADALVGVSLGESAGLFATRAWRGRDEMFGRIERSTLFASDLAPPYNAARAFWELPASEPADWTSALVACGPDDVTAALRPGLRAYLLMVNAPAECVIGGRRADVQQLARALDKPLVELDGVTLAHCAAGRPVEGAYRELHTLPVTPPAGVTVYSGAWGKSYKPDSATCADSITAGLVGPIDVPRLIETAYGDGVRAFLEVGPGASCTRLIGAILGDRPHLARAAHAPRQDAVSQIVRLVAHLAAERFPVDFGALYGGPPECVAHIELPAPPRIVRIPVGLPPRAPTVEAQPPAPPSTLPAVVLPASAPPPAEPLPVSAPAAVAANVMALNMQAQEAFLRVNQRFAETTSHLLRMQLALVGASMRAPTAAVEPTRPAPTDAVPRALTFEQCCTFAAGRVGDVLGPRFAEVDSFPTRVRLPDRELQLVDRITLIEGEPLSMTSGRVVTEHTVRADRWYLEAGRIPTAVAVESGQADLFLSGFLGIDFQTRGLAVYRLLDAVVSFHRALPRVGETVVYDIHIDRFVKQGNSWLFHFWFDGRVVKGGTPGGFPLGPPPGEKFITMRNGVAGFFTAEALAAGKGVVQTTLDKQARPGKKSEDWRDLVPLEPAALDASQVDALRAGDLVRAFGSHFAKLNVRRPATIPGGKLRLVDRVPLIDPRGGRFGIGFVRAEFDIDPKAWFLTCHFVDDMVMPGTLMYECCLHTLRVLLMRLGWIGEADQIAHEPVPGVNSRLKCRGQVLPSTRVVTYEVTVKELGYGPEPFCLADALMCADGKPIVEITNMSLRVSGLTREQLETAWGERKPLYDSAKIMAYSNGKPSEGFGEPYRVFDSERVIARLPGPPFQFLDCITEVTGEPFVLKAGASCVAEYAVPRDAWYFDANRSEIVPFAVLLEIALQPCGWLAAYCGSALTSPVDLSFRNLGGTATQLRPVTRDTGLLKTRVKMTSVSNSAGMIIQHYDMLVSDSAGDVYKGTTYFGFFTKDALANQVGIQSAKVPWPSESEAARAERTELPHDAPFPAPMLRMVDQIPAYVPDGGAKGLGLVVGTIAVDPEFWFFKAHFYQDPVWPGSLGVESFLQLLKFAAWKRWGHPTQPYQTVAVDAQHSWVYRGQVLPKDREVKVVLEVVAADDHNRRLTANGFLTVDGRVIYQMTGFSLQ